MKFVKNKSFMGLFTKYKLKKRMGRAVQKLFSQANKKKFVKFL